MFDIAEELRFLVAKLNEHDIEYALCGGMAMAVHQEPRMTVAIDMLIQKKSLADVMTVAHELGYTIRGLDMTFANGAVEIRRISKIDPDAGDVLSLDFLLVTAEVRTVWESRIESEWEGGRLSVVSREGLIALKKLSGRPQDLVDIDALMEDAGDETS